MRAPFDITVPSPDSTTAKQWFGRYLRDTLSQLAAFPMGRFDARTFDSFADVRAHVGALGRAGNLGLVFSILRRPAVSTLVRCLNSELYGAGDVRKLDDWLSELTTLLLFELAVAGELPPGGVLLPARPRVIHSASSRVRITVDDSARLGFLPGHLVLDRAGQRTEIDVDVLSTGADADPAVTVDHPYVPIVDDLCLAMADNNPLSEFEAHPEKSGNSIDLGRREASEWVAVLRRAVDLIDEFLPEVGRELRLVMHTFVPVGFDAERHVSASYAEAIGTAYLSLHPDVLTMTEAVVHEFSHNKLNLVWAADPVLQNAFSPLYGSPVRPDPRPLHGVMLAVHAFVPVALLYERMFEARHALVQSDAARKRFEAIVGGNREGTRTLLENARPTEVGRAILDELGRWDAHFAA